VYGDLQQNPNDMCIVNHEAREIITIYPTTVGQFTGLKDKDGREVYEGDIYSNLYGQQPFFVIFDDASASFGLRYMTQSGDHSMRYLPGGMIYVGNIHDNPEMIGDGQ
jgi:hypothetical protein